MDIQPRPCTLKLWDGTIETLFTFRDFTYLVEYYMGHEAARWLENHVERLEEAANAVEAELNSDLRGYEMSLESNIRAFQDVEEICRSMVADFHKEPGRNRVAALRPWFSKIAKIIDIIDNQT